jgi:choline dehydrogenase
MGTGEGSVVDSAGRVHGAKSLRVVDASIMPTTVTANISAAVYMLAEKISDEMLGRACLQARLH